MIIGSDNIRLWCATVAAVALPIVLPQLAGADGLLNSARSDNSAFVPSDVLRASATDDLDKGQADGAIAKIREALKREPGDIASHIILAKALTAKFHQKPTDVQIYAESIDEWRYVKNNTRDDFEADEAVNQLMQLKLDRVISRAAGKTHPRFIDVKLLSNRKAKEQL